PPHPFDDPSITYRYAESLADGYGFTFNAGERVLGTSTPLYTLILAVGALIGFPIAWFSVSIETLATVLMGMLIIAHFRAARQPWAGIAVVLLLATVSRHHLSLALYMETALCMAAILGVCVAMRYGHFALAVLLAAPVALLRPEGVLIAIPLLWGLVGGHRQWWPERRRLLWAFIVSGLVAGAWFLFALLYFGDPVPNSVHAKAAHSWNTPSEILPFGGVILQRLTWHPDGFHDQVILIWIGLAFIVVRDRGSHPLLMWAMAYILFMTLGQAPNFPWYGYPITIVMFIAIGHAIGLIGDLMRRRLSATVTTLLCALILMIALRGDLRITIVTARDPRTDFKGYPALARWFRTSTPPDSRVGSMEVGIIGHQSGHYISDVMGLLTPSVIPYLRPGHELPNLLRLLPDYAVYTELIRPRESHYNLGPDLLRFYVEDHLVDFGGLSSRFTNTAVLRRADYLEDRCSAGLAFGDLNGDGARDTVVGLARTPEPLTEIRILLGAPASGEMTVSLSGGSVTSVACGDHDGDGLDDLILGLADVCSPDRLFCGAVWIVPGALIAPDHGLLIEADAEDVPLGHRRIFGEDHWEGLGWSVASADLNGDGLAEAIAGAPRSASRGNSRHQAGEVVIVWGGAAASPTTVWGAGEHDQTGWALACGDFDDDGIDDLAIGSRGGAGSADVGVAVGEVCLVRGSADLPGRDLDLAVGPLPGVLRAYGNVSMTAMGAALAMGDISGDGRDDLLIGSPCSRVGRERMIARGMVNVILGTPNLWECEMQVSGFLGMRDRRELCIIGGEKTRRAGWTLATGDVTGDGIDDALIGAFSPEGEGEIHMLEGGEAMFSPPQSLNRTTRLRVNLGPGWTWTAAIALLPAEPD
ncbi:FG-GAP repeat protein, partial [Candidatus Sumerlaeota bacterium]|nr:FG-GAP repeat protein [Candidatus Sumerlaeota bacterium]